MIRKEQVRFLLQAAFWTEAGSRLVESQYQGIDLDGPLRGSKNWQVRIEGAYDHT